MDDIRTTGKISLLLDHPVERNRMQFICSEGVVSLSIILNDFFSCIKNSPTDGPVYDIQEESITMEINPDSAGVLKENNHIYSIEYSRFNEDEESLRFVDPLKYLIDFLQKYEDQDLVIDIVNNIDTGPKLKISVLHSSLDYYLKNKSLIQLMRIV